MAHGLQVRRHLIRSHRAVLSQDLSLDATNSQYSTAISSRQPAVSHVPAKGRKALGARRAAQRNAAQRNEVAAEHEHAPTPR